MSKNKIKSLPEVAKLHHKEYISFMKNGNTSRPIKYWLADYLKLLTESEKEELIYNMARNYNNEIGED